MPLTKDTVLATLSKVQNPATGGDIVSAGMVQALNVQAGDVSFVLDIGDAAPAQMAPVQEAAKSALEQVSGVGKVSVVMTAHSAPKDSPKKPPELSLKPKAGARPGPQPLPGVAQIIAVASGKGGVGKSTVAANLAAALSVQGRKVGLLDADVYGPSQPRMLGVSGKPASPDGKTILPLKGHGITMMSMGVMVDEDQALAWRGPMLMGALQQMLLNVQWGELDVLIVDLPPGTGDVQMTLAQKVPLTGAIIVSTPQDIALLDARKGVNMFEKLNVPILGMIENMSTHVCSACGHEEHIFGHGGVRADAEKLGVPVLAELPLALPLREAADSGTPLALSDPEAPQAKPFHDLAKGLIAQGVA
ncbi:hypothetical protein ATO10_03495 [Actibacterium atlanticum]|uniref:Iron-sulfur cluster carrier protein n=1 Tax=Actibacterium atlanticum TaxID=1461693 RepID=A0A058ZQH4_9RHOB|nr:Mrp/NBP35 family ATP-binding protein [Actibacterium atlanticum]KCV83793.1 hypothetical protein ATO10_03495 [Actibacterium atlanticum]